MGPGLVTTTQASSQKNRVAITTVKTKNQKNARKNYGKSAASRVDSGIGANAVAAEVTRRNVFDGKIRLVTSAATTS